jgi:hypothetical protein
MDTNSENRLTPEVGYERQDLGHRGVLVFFAFLLIAGIVIHIAIWAMYMGFERYARSTEPPLSPLAPKEPPAKTGRLQNTPSVNLDRFAVPRLQSNDVWDMGAFRKQEEKVLNAGAYEENGTVHLPIDAAMQALVQKGLPARSNANDPSRRDPMMVPTGAGFPGLQQAFKSTVEPSAEGAREENPQAETKQPPEAQRR